MKKERKTVLAKKIIVVDTIEIERCPHCDYFRSAIYRERPYNLVGDVDIPASCYFPTNGHAREVKDQNTIPEWCPLVNEKPRAGRKVTVMMGRKSQ